MAFFWVNLGTSYKEVADGKFLWAPAHSLGKEGQKKTNAGWEPVQEVQAGDVIFCHRLGNIIYVAVALADAYQKERPSSRVFDQWRNEGYQIDVDLTILMPVVSVGEFKQTLIAVHNPNCVPALFDKNGGTAQQYMVRLPLGAGALILSHLSDAEFVVCEKMDARKKGKRLLVGGSREVRSQARLGQGQFREEVLAIWGGKCSVTGLARKDLLVASHIFPWSLSDEVEKIDPHNGLLLSPAVDKLFDKGYISFDKNGTILVKSSAISHADLQLMGVFPNAKILGLKDRHRVFLTKHRELFHF
jgi:putative restriction endonuclease